jgi:hypothetical protein
MLTPGISRLPNTAPIIKIVEVTDLIAVHSLISNDTVKRKNRPQIKASLDKNNSQRIRTFYVITVILQTMKYQVHPEIFCGYTGKIVSKLYDEFQLKIALFCPT